MKKLVAATVGLLATAGVLAAPVGGGAPAEVVGGPRVATMDLSAFPAEPPKQKLSLLFIHHSCGGQLLAPPGPDKERANCVYEAHGNGGDARRKLAEAGYEVHEASYESEIGDKTDLFDWLPKFRDKHDKILRVDENDRFFTDGRAHRIVMFKSCYPNNDYVGEGAPPGDPRGPELTYWNARATLTALRDELAKHPDVLYVYLTPPPRAPRTGKERLVKLLAKKALGKPTAAEALGRQAAIARKLNDWVVAKDGWLAGYPHRNVVVFDYYDVLTGEGASNLSRYAGEGGYDSHPTNEGNAKAAAALVPFLNRAVRRAGLSD